MSRSRFRSARVIAATAAACWAAVCCTAVAIPQGTPASPAGVGWGSGGLRVTPTRVVLEGRRRGAELTLVNTGSASATYRISIVHMRMDESGAMTEIDSAAAGEAFADTLVRYSPRQVELGPGEAQTVRVQLRVPAGLPDAEYRSHLILQAVPTTAAAPDSGGRAAVAAGEVRIGLTPVFGVAIPLIVRHGSTWARVAMADARLDRPSVSDTTGSVALTLTRTGTRSVYGDLTVFQVPVRGRPRAIGSVRGVAVYVPNAVRRVRIPLQSAHLEDLMRGALRVVYQDPAVPDSVLAETELRLP